MKKLGLALFLASSLDAHFLWEPFDDAASVAANGWHTNFMYGREGLMSISPQTPTCDSNQTNSRVDFSNGRVQFRGVPNINNTSQSIWAGFQLKLTNRSFNASAQDPFGYSMLRRISWIDPVGSCREGAGGPSPRQIAELNSWIFQNTSIGASFEPYPYSISFSELSQGILAGAGQTFTNSRSRFLIYDGVQRDVDTTNGIGPSGNAVNLAANLLPGGTNFSWFYEDSLGGTTNTNALGIRITHDGSTINFFLNGNPLDNPSCGFPNEWVWVGARSVSWSTNLGIMFGHGVNRFDQELAMADYDWVSVRSVSSGTAFRMERTPGRVGDATPELVRIEIEAKVEGPDAGIGEIWVNKPKASPSWAPRAWRLERGGRPVPVLWKAGNPPVGEVYATAHGADAVLLRFHKGSGKTSEVWRAGESLVLHAALRPALLPREETLEIYVDNEKFSDTAPDLAVRPDGIAYATTGRQKAVLLPPRLLANRR